MLKLWDLRCPECGAEKIDEFVRDEQYPECCGLPMKTVPAAMYLESERDRRRRKRNPSVDFTPDAMTTNVIQGALNKARRERGGTGNL
jgi:hypothetical protein